MKRIRAWAEETEVGDRDELVPAPAEKAWRSLSVNAHECLGATRCPYATDCFSEAAREKARHADVVVTNHAMLAIDAMSGIPLLPEHDVVVIDEAHELVDRATQAITDELTSGMVERAARRARKHVAPETHDALLTAAELPRGRPARDRARSRRGAARRALRRPGRGPRCGALDGVVLRR